MNGQLFLFFAFICITTGNYSQTTCAVKIGSNYYINCKHIITFQNMDVLNATYSDNTIKPSFDVNTNNGLRVASVVNGVLTTGNKNDYTVKSTETEYSFIENSSSRIICLIKKTFDKKNNRCELQVWVDMYLPDGTYFQCTPETTNMPFLNYMTGSTFENAYSAITLE